MKLKLKFLLFLSLVILNFPIPISSDETTMKISREKYDTDWQAVYKHESEGLPKSALEKVAAIYKKAVTENNPSQIVKSVIHRVKYIGQVEEEAFVKAIEELQKEADSAKGVEKPIFHSMLGDIYWQYYQNNRYYIHQRTNVVKDVKQADLRTWDSKKLIEECVKQYTLSVTDVDFTKTIKTDEIHTILNYESDNIPNGRKLRPTIYDFLAHRAVDFFAGQEQDVIRPAEDFILDNPDYLLPAPEFVKLKIESKNEISYKYHALRILQDLLAFHIEDKQPDAFLDVELKRLDFVLQYAVNSDKNTLYLKALNNLFEIYKASPLSTDITYAIAKFWLYKGEEYETEPLEKKWVIKKAYTICDSAINSFPNSDGSINCKALQSNITQKSISLNTEKVNLIDKPFRALLNFKNVDNVYFRIYKTDRKEINGIKKVFNDYYNKHKSYLDYDVLLMDHFFKEKAEKSFSQKLPNEKDYREHRAEIKIPALPAGQYFIAVSATKGFDKSANTIGFAFVNISNLAHIEKSISNNNIEYFILDRETGEKVPEAKITIHKTIYNNKTSQYENIQNVYTTDKEGYVKIKAGKDYRSFGLMIQKDEDALEDIEDYYNYYSYRTTPYYQSAYYKRQKNPSYTNAYLFLDRAIYRPGQTVHFKGIVIRSEEKERSLVTGEPITASFHNTHGKVIANLELKTNDFGTFSGTFTTPNNTLNGQMRISTSHYGNASFSVEEYKRPKFAVEIEKVKGSFRLKEKITVKGNAKAFSGANIDGADIKYRVIRTARFPYWFYRHWGFYPSSPSKEIAQGTLKTDEAGKFSIEFEAIPDLSIPASSKPTFTYEVTADVTDLNGETRTGRSSVNVAYSAINIDMALPSEISVSSESPYEIQTTNMSGEFEPAEGKIKVYKLKTPERVFRTRQWQRPDASVMKREDYYQNFPNDPYMDDDDPEKWGKEKETQVTSFDTAKEKNFTFGNLKSWKPGKYVLEISAKDKYGEEVNEIKYFTLRSSNLKSVPYPVYAFSSNPGNAVEPGETAKILFGSSLNANVIFEVDMDDQVLKREWVQINNEVKSFTYPVEEKHRGNIYFKFAFVRNNQFYSGQESIYIPYSNKQLALSFETFRNKLLPGEGEEWRIKLVGPKAEKVSAEMLAALYDASLDTFRPNYWNFNIFPSNGTTALWNANNEFSVAYFRLRDFGFNTYHYGTSKYYDTLNYYGLYLYNFRGFYYYHSRGGYGRSYDEYEEDMDDSAGEAAPRKTRALKKNGVPMRARMAEAPTATSLSRAPAAAAPVTEMKEKAADMPAPAPEEARTEDASATGGNSGKEISGVKARTNFNETAFFYPHLKTDKDGTITISFTVPEALTKWKMMGFAHTKDLKYGFIFNELVTQKDLMVVPNAPRFFREGDEMEFTAKVTNLTKEDINGGAQIELFEAVSMRPLIGGKDSALLEEKYKEIQIKKEQSTMVNWKLKIPAGVQAITYRVLAKAGKVSDGEEMTLPVLTNRMLVTETLPLPMRGKDTKNFTFDKLLTNKSDTLVHHKYTVEYTLNPAWYAVQALPYLMEYPYECAEQLFHRYYANSIAHHIANSNPKIKAVFDQWKEAKGGDAGALLSNLEKNQELKSVVLEETPWLLDALDEQERKKRVALLFDMNKMGDELKRALDKLKKLQGGNGAFPWFTGMPENRYITQMIVTGMGHLDHLGIKKFREDKEAWRMLISAVKYLDSQMQYDYERLLEAEKKDGIDISKQHIWYFQIQYLYARSFFKDIVVDEQNSEGFEYYRWQAKTYWNEFISNKNISGMLALALFRLGEETPEKNIKALSSHKLKNFAAVGVPDKMVKSFRETSLNNEELGMYWKSGWGYFWYELPIETQSIMIEVFSEIAQDEKAVGDLKTWLLKNKQTTDWRTTTATANALYALLLKGQDWLSGEQGVEIKVGNKTINSNDTKKLNPESGSGYFKLAYDGSEVTSDMGKISITPLIPKNTKTVSDMPSWGAVYWQYFEQLDKITPAETPLKLNKKLFLKKNTLQGPQLIPIDDKLVLNPGDTVVVRIELRVDREMEFVHMKDMRASSFEPINVFSRYKWQDGLGYYESTRDAATNFFFDSLPKGTYVFEYPLRVTHKGNYSNGITSIQCMYAPEFSSHSEGIRVKIGN